MIIIKAKSDWVVLRWIQSLRAKTWINHDGENDPVIVICAWSGSRDTSPPWFKCSEAGGPEEIQRRSRGDPEEIQRRSRGDPEEVQRRSRGDPEEVQRRSRGDPEEIQRWSRGGPEEVQRRSWRKVNSVPTTRRGRRVLHHWVPSAKHQEQRSTQTFKVDVNHPGDREEWNPPVLSSESVVVSLCVCRSSLYFSSTSWKHVITTQVKYDGRKVWTVFKWFGIMASGIQIVK